MTDEELARRLTEALDARIDRAAEKAGAVIDRPHEATAASVQANEPIPIRAVPARRVRLRAAAAAVLALCVLGAGAFLLWKLPLRGGPSPADPGDTTEDTQTTAPEPENCHLETFPDGESVWVLDRAYTGDYHVQKKELACQTEADAPWYGSVELPEGFLRQEILDYAAYTAYCAEFDLEQTYSDESARYLVIAYAEAHADSAEVLPVDVIVRGDRVWIWLWDSVTGFFTSTTGCVLTVPLPASATILEEPIPVLKASEAEDQKLFHSTELTENPDGSLTIRGWTAGTRYVNGTTSSRKYLMFYNGSEQILLQANLSADLIGAYESGIELLAENCVPIEPQAEGYDRWYRSENVTVLSLNKARAITFAKPVIYLYPEAETRVEVKLDLDGALTCTYPAYGDGWAVTVAPDGTLTDDAGQIYNYLYWEGTNDGEFDFSRGFCVAGADTAAFLEDALARLGLTRREANEFIVYWLPLMQESPYNLIAFQGAAYTDRARLEVSPAPDTVLRVFMAWTPLEGPVEIEPQDLTAPEREGFILVEWGGSRVD